MSAITEHPGVSDQASGLRRLLSPRPIRVLPVAGGLPPPVQAEITASLARAIAEGGRSVMIVDQSHGEVPMQFGMRARYELAQIINADCDSDDVVLHPFDGISILPAARGLSIVARSGSQGLTGGLVDAADIVILNLLSIAPVLPLIDSGSDWLVLASANPTGLLPAYSQIKLLARNAAPGAYRVLIHGSKECAGEGDAFGSLARIASRFLGVDLSSCGGVPLGDRVMRRDLLKVSSAVRRIATEMDNWSLGAVPNKGGTPSPDPTIQPAIAWS